MIKLFKYLRPREWGMIAASVVLIVTQVFLDLRLPEYMSEVTLYVQTGAPVEDVVMAGINMLLCAFGSLALAITVGYFAARIAAGFSRRVRGLVYDKVESFSMQEINKFSTSSLITRSTNDITQIRTVVAMGLQIIIKAPIMAIWALSRLSATGWEWTAVTGAAVLVLVIMLLTIVIFALPKFKRVQKLTDGLNGVTREGLTGLRVVRAYNAEQYQNDKFGKVNNELTKTNLFTSRLMGILQPGMMLISSGLTLGIYWIGAILIDAAGVMDRLTIFSDMVVFTSYAMQVVFAFMMLTVIFILIPRASVSALRIREVLDTKQSIKDGTIKETTGDIKGELEFKNVSFKYPDAADYVIKDINFKAEQGQTVAFIGSTGSGKTTLINLIPRFYDATDGEILVDGINVKEYELSTLYNKIGYVPQRSVIFSGTIESNVTYGQKAGEPATMDDVKRAVAIAQGTEFVEKMEGGYEASISQGGTNISGGQKQRVSIARAICKDPEMYVFDDSFSALDYKTDRMLRSELRKQTGDKTNIVVAQRIGTIIDADKIIVLDKGEIVGMGTHRELLNTCDVYKEIAYSQLSKEELEDE